MGELTEAPETPFYCLSARTSSAHSSVLSHLCFLPKDGPKDCYCPKVDSNSGEGDSDTYRLGFSSRPGGPLPPFSLGFPQPDRIRASGRVPLSPLTQSSGCPSPFPLVFLSLISSRQAGTCHC